MKKMILMMLLLVSVSANAQKDVTKFLGIPVDGYKTEMKQKLIEKGFTYNVQQDILEGEFNGYKVFVHIITYNNKVWRIMVYDAISCGESDIKIRFNKLCGQFAKNKKYRPTNMFREYTLSENEDIGHEMLVNNKRYEASYYQALDPELIDSIAIQQRIKDALLREYTQEQIDNPTAEQAEDIERIKRNETLNMSYDMLEKKSVWFMICKESYGRYSIAMYYDNEYNHADGEDL